MAAPVGVEALNIARNFLQSVRFVPLANKEIVRASAVGAASCHLNQKAGTYGRQCGGRTLVDNERYKDNQR